MRQVALGHERLDQPVRRGSRGARHDRNLGDGQGALGAGEDVEDRQRLPQGFHGGVVGILELSCEAFGICRNRHAEMTCPGRRRYWPRMRSVKARPTERDYLMACGLIGEPVPPVMMSGGPQKKNSYTPSLAQSSANSFR